MKIREKVLWFAIVLAFAGGAAATEKTVWNWGTAIDTVAGDSSFEQSKAICRRLGASVIPSADRPSASEAKRLKDCDSQALYYGEGMSPDYVKARLCAIVEDERGGRL